MGSLRRCIALFVKIWKQSYSGIPKFTIPNGNLHIERVRYHSIFVDKFIEADRELGLNLNIDYTVDPEYGATRLQATLINGRRVNIFTLIKHA